MLSNNFYFKSLFQLATANSWIKQKIEKLGKGKCTI